MHVLHAVLLALIAAQPAGATEPPEYAGSPSYFRWGEKWLSPQPVPQSLLTKPLLRWSFEKDADGWTAEHDCKVAAERGTLRIQSTGDDPYLTRTVDALGGTFLLELRMRSRTAGGGTVYWGTDKTPGHSEQRAARFAMQHDGQWHDYAVPFTADGRLRSLRLDPGAAPGEIEVESVRLLRAGPHPLVIERVDVLADCVRATVKNQRAAPLAFSAVGKTFEIDDGASVAVDCSLAGNRPLEAATFELVSQGLPPVRRTLFVFHEKAREEWIERGEGKTAVRIARNGSVARIERNGILVGVLGPLVHCDGKLPSLKLVDEGPTVRFEGDGVKLAIDLRGNEISVSIESEKPCEGPVVRALGDMKQGIFAGVEYLSQGEPSSSKLDIETDEHVRFAPDPLKVTMPLMSFVTDRATLAMTWSDMKLQPVFATPNFFDCTGDHRMALRGRRIEATIAVSGGTLEDTILWAVKKRGLPPLPEPPRTPDEQWKLCLQAFNGPLKTEAGWGHCVEPNWARHPFADIASAVWRLSGEVPKLPRLVPGGGHVQNESIYFVTGRAQEWLDMRTRHVQGLLKQQQADGSFRYDGPYRRGHFENTASGVCARPTMELLEFARLTGDRATLEAGVRGLRYMKRFCVPRGAQVWECPLHTPDQLASAYLVWAYVRGYELTGDKEFLAEARRWALSGVPFVYLWSQRPIMLYATPPVLGATNWQAPNWIGLPVQWVGGVYAYSLAMLAPHDKTLDWNQLARGILIAAEQMQYPDGEYAGLLPDVFELKGQERRPARINPSALVCLQFVLDGQLDGLAVAADAKRRIVAPFPATIRDGRAHVRAKAGAKYQVLIDGRRIVDVVSRGDDDLPLDGGK